MSESAPDPVRVAVVGTGMMGADHVRRLSIEVPDVRVCAVVDADLARAEAAAATTPGAAAFAALTAALEAEKPDAVLIATPGWTHEELLLQVIHRGLPVLCEKPLTDDAAAALRVIQAEAAFGRRLIQVGFMRRFDVEYQQLRSTIQAGTYGAPLILHARHRAPDVSALPNFSEPMLITDSVVHEIDILRYLTGEEIRAVTVITPRASSSAPVRSPQLVLLETSSGIVADVEINVSAGYGYEVSAELVLEFATLEQGRPRGLLLRHDSAAGVSVPRDFRDRFADAYRRELAGWVASIRGGEHVGADAWDGYAAQAVCEAGLQAQRHPGAPVQVRLEEQPALYRKAAGV